MPMLISSIQTYYFKPKPKDFAFLSFYSNSCDPPLPLPLHKHCDCSYIQSTSNHLGTIWQVIIVF